MNTFRSEIFECSCDTFEHSVRFSFDPNETDIRFLEVYVDTVFPVYRGFWSRLVIGAKYIWNGHYTDYTGGGWILKHQDEARLKAFFIEYECLVWKLKSDKRKAEAKVGDNAVIEKDSVH